MSRISFLCIVIVVTLLLIPAAYADSNDWSGKAMDEVSLREQVTIEWEARLKNNWAAIYDLTSNGYKKNSKKELFGAKSNAHSVEYNIKSIEINTDKKEAKVQVDHTINNNGIKFPFVATERWIWEKNHWYLVPLQ